MNWWGPLILILVGLALGVAALGPSLFPREDEQARQRLAERLQAWAGIQDFQVTLEVWEGGEPTLRLKVLCLVGLAVRLEIQEPEDLAGEVYALRAVPEGWLLVHFRPSLSLGLEARFPEHALGPLLGGLGPVDLQKLRIRWPQEDVVQVNGLSGPFPSVELRFVPGLALPESVAVTDPSGRTLELRLRETRINGGLELRELLLLDPLPTRWIPIPAPAGGA